MAALTAWRALVTRGRLTGGGGRSVLGRRIDGNRDRSFAGLHRGGRDVLPDKAATARDLGALHVVERTSAVVGGSITEHLRGRADLAPDPTGALWQPFAEALRPGGRLVVVGQMATRVGQLKVQTLYWRQLDVLGSSMGSLADIAAMFDNIVRYQWAPSVDAVFPLEAISQAYDRLNSSQRSGKVVIGLLL